MVKVQFQVENWSKDVSAVDGTAGIHFRRSEAESLF